MKLANYQVLLLQGIKNPDIIQSENEYHRRLLEGDYIQRVRNIALWWRSKQIEDLLPLTTKYLKLSNKFGLLVEQYYNQVSVSSYIEQNIIEFMHFIIAQNDNVASCLVRLEIGLRDIALQKTIERQLLWPCNVMVLLDGLINHNSININHIPHWMRLSHRLEFGMEVIELPNGDS